METDVRVGYVGLGDMGGPMAANLADHGFEVWAYDLRDEALERAAEHGVRRAASVAELAGSVDVLCTCLHNSDQAREVFLSADGIVRTARPGLVVTIHSTLTPDLVIEIGDEAARAGVMLVDAPVSGGREQSGTGALTVMVGCTDEAFEVVEPVVQAIGERIFRVGAIGAGQAVKLGNNIMGLCNQLIAMEAVRLASAYGVQAADLFEVAMVSSGASRSLANYAMHDEYQHQHTAAGTDELPFLMAKDLREALRAAEARRTTLPIVGVCSQLSPRMYAERWAAEPALAVDRRGVEGRT